MRSMIGNEEAKLVLALMHKKAEVPEDLKAKALEQLRLYSMACEAGSAKGYLIDKLIEAVENDDIDKAIEVSEMAAVCIDGDPDLDDDDVVMDPELEEMAHEAIDNFVSMLEGEGFTEQEAASVLKKVMDKLSFIPLLIVNGMMIGYGGMHNRIIVFGMNFEGDLAELAEKYRGIDDKQRLMSVLRRQFDWDDEIEVGLAVLKYKKIDDDGTIEMIIRSL